MSLNDFTTEMIEYNWHNTSIFIFSDNDFEYIPPEIKNMVNLRILALRDNELVEIPQVYFM